MGEEEVEEEESIAAAAFALAELLLGATVVPLDPFNCCPLVLLLLLLL